MPIYAGWWKAAAALLVLLASLLVAAPAHAEVPVVVWLSVTGSDSNDGTQSAPVLTLARVQDILRATAPTTDVEIRIGQGTYVAGQLTWDFYIPGHTITFMPHDYEIGENVTGIAGRPVFRSDTTPGYWLVAKIPPSHTSTADLTGGLRFYYLTVERYGQGGLMLYGRTSIVSGIRTPGAALTGNTVAGMVFQRMGSKWSGQTGYGGVSLSNSSSNYIGNNHFSSLENVAPSQGGVHGVYALHGSSNNTIRGNAFSVISGHPMRVRNQSNGNDIHENTFTLTGGYGYSEWFCDAACVSANPGANYECASQGNVFHHNNLVSGYTGGYLRLWLLTPPGLTFPGPAGCPALSGPRLATYGNT
jgi:hypothetical protein